MAEMSTSAKVLFCSLTLCLSSPVLGETGGTTVPFAVTGGLFPGTGVDINAPWQQKGECVNYGSLELDTTGAYQTQMTTRVISKFEMYKKDTLLSLGYQATAKATVGGISANSDFKITGKFGSIDERESSTLVVMFTANSDNGRRIAVNYGLKPDRAALLVSNPQEFRSQCGTHFVRAVHRGSDATVFVKITGLSESGKRSLETSLENTVGGGFKLSDLGEGDASVKVTAEYKKIIDFAKRAGRVEISYFAFGGPGISTTGPLAGLTDPADLKAIGTALQTATSGFTGDNAAPIDFILAPYTEFGASPTQFDPARIELVGKLTEQLLRVDDALKVIASYKADLPTHYSQYFAKPESQLTALRSNIVDRISSCASGDQCSPVLTDVLDDFVFLGDVFSKAKTEASCTYQLASNLVGGPVSSTRVLEGVTINVEATAPFYTLLDFSNVKMFRMSPDLALEDASSRLGEFSIAPTPNGESGRKLFGSLYYKNIRPADALKRNPASGELMIDRIVLGDRRDDILKSMYVLEVSGPGGRTYGFNLGFPDRQQCNTLVQ